MSDIQIGLLLLAVGFPTVFFILYLVIILGKGLILVVNKYAPEETPSTIAPVKTNTQAQISSGKLSAIVSVVQHITGGKGHVTKVEKL